MELLVVLDSLIFDVVVYHGKIAVLPHRIGVVAWCPEISSPQKRFYLWVFSKDMSCGDAFDLFDQVWKPYVWNRLDEKMVDKPMQASG